MKMCIKWFLCTCLLVLTLFACDKNEIARPLETPNDSLSVESMEISVLAAKKWFDNEYLPSQKLNESESAKKMIRNIFWNKAYFDQMSNGQELLIIPIEHHDPGKPANADTYLWVFRDDNNRLTAKVIEYLSSVTDRKKDSEISLINFSGAMTVRDWNGYLLNGFTFINGESKGLLLNVNGVETDRVAKAKSGRANGTVCNDVYFTRSTCTSFMYKICENGNCTDLKPNDTATFCDFYEFRIKQCYWVADFPSQTNPYSGNNSGITATSPEDFSIPGYDHPAIDIAKYIKCFGVIDNNSKYKVTIYVDEPNSGTGKTIWGKNVGHAFIGLEKNTGGMITRQVVGFYPDAKTANWVDSHMANNGGDPYTVSTTYEPYADGFQAVLNSVIYQQSQMYHTAQYNCTTAIAYICDAAGFTFPKNESYFPFFVAKGLSPGRLGLDLKNNQSSGILNTNKGFAPYSNGPCN